MLKLLAVIALCVFVQTAAAESGASPCKELEYAQAKTGDKAGLLSEYCFAIIHADSEDRMHKIEEDGIAQKRAIPADTSENERNSMDFLKSAGSCRVRAAQIEIALRKRFKIKPPKSCD